MVLPCHDELHGIFLSARLCGPQQQQQCHQHTPMLEQWHSVHGWHSAEFKYNVVLIHEFYSCSMSPDHASSIYPKSIQSGLYYKSSEGSLAYITNLQIPSQNLL